MNSYSRSQRIQSVSDSVAIGRCGYQWGHVDGAKADETLDAFDVSKYIGLIIISFLIVLMNCVDQQCTKGLITLHTRLWQQSVIIIYYCSKRVCITFTHGTSDMYVRINSSVSSIG